MDIDDAEFPELRPGRGIPARWACRARALAIISIGRLFAAAGRRALLSMPDTLELGCMRGVDPWGSDMVRKEGTRRGNSAADCEGGPPMKDGAASEEELGGSSGVLASEETSSSSSSSSDLGEPGVSICSSGVAGTESGDSVMVYEG